MKNAKKAYFIEQSLTAMYGPMWRRSLVDVFGIPEKQAAAWLAGEEEIPSSFLRTLQSSMHRQIATTSAAALELTERLARDMPDIRIVFLPNYRLADLRPDIGSEGRKWFDIEGILYANHPNGAVIDVSGNDVSLPAWVTPEALLVAETAYLNSIPDID